MEGHSSVLYASKNYRLHGFSRKFSNQVRAPPRKMFYTLIFAFGELRFACMAKWGTQALEDDLNFWANLDTMSGLHASIILRIRSRTKKESIIEYDMQFLYLLYKLFSIWSGWLITKETKRDFHFLQLLNKLFAMWKEMTLTMWHCGSLAKFLSICLLQWPSTRPSIIYWKDFVAVWSKYYERMSEFSDQGKNLARKWVFIRTCGRGFMGHPHASIMYQVSGQNS